MDSKKFAIWGDCVSQGIVSEREHTRALGFINWVSLLSDFKINEDIFRVAEKIQMSQYNIRNLKLDLNKKAINYLLEEKADFLLIDPNDCRMEVASVNDEIAYTISAAGGNYMTK